MAIKKKASVKKNKPVGGFAAAGKSKAVRSASTASFDRAAKIAAELEKKKGTKNEAVSEPPAQTKQPFKVSAYIPTPVEPLDSRAYKSETKTVTTTVTSSKETPLQRTPYDPLPKTPTLKGRNLSEIGQKANSSEELVGFDDFSADDLRRVEERHAEIKMLDSQNSGLMEMLGGATMILIAIEVVVIMIILISMFLLK